MYKSFHNFYENYLMGGKGCYDGTCSLKPL